MNYLKLLNFAIISIIVISAGSASLSMITADDVGSAIAVNNTIYVSTIGNDTGDGSYLKPFKTLNKAIGAVSDGGSIHVANGAYKGPLNRNLTINKSMEIVQDTSIQGLGQYVEIDGQRSDQIFLVENVRFSLKNLTIYNGQSYDIGGALVNDGGAVTLNNCNFHNNDGDHFGGAISNIGNLTIENSNFTFNTAGDEEGGLGGAIQNLGNLTVSGTTFTNNSAGMENSNGGGGAIVNFGLTKVINSDFTSNLGGTGAGAIYNLKNLSIINSSFEKNRAMSYGGAIVNANYVNIIGSSFSDNNADYGGVMDNYVGICIVTNSSFAQNHADIKGGAFYATNTSNLTIKGSKLIKNNAGDDGGSIYNKNSLNIQNSVINENNALKNGGAIYNALNGNLNFINTNITQNKATNTGGGVYTIGTLTKDSLTSITNNFPNDIAPNLIYVSVTGSDQNDGTSLDKAKRTIQNAVDNVKDNDVIKVTSGTYKENIRISKSIELIGENRNTTIIDGNQQNSCITITKPQISVKLNDFTIMNGKADVGAGINNNGSLTIKNSIITQNSAVNLVTEGGWGGGILNLGSLDIENSLVQNNRAQDNQSNGGGWGGGICNDGNLNIKTSTISSNTAKYGAGIWNDAGAENTYELNLINTTISGNIAKCPNGCSGNTTSYGGGIINFGDMNVINSIITCNTADNGAGIVNEFFYFPNATQNKVTLTDSSINNNMANGNGGGIYNINGSVILKNSEVTDNSAAIEGGGIINYDILSYDNATQIKDNKPDDIYPTKILYVATNGNDGNDGSVPAKAKRTIQNALNMAKPNDIIQVASGTYTENIQINKNIVLMGADQDTTIIDGNYKDRCVLIPGNVNVVIRGFTFKNGKGFGAGLYNGGKLALINTLFTHNAAVDAGNSAGGGIFNAGTLNMEDSSIINNTAINDGGGILNLGDVTIKRLIITGNTAFNGGGICNLDITRHVPELMVEDSLITNNTGSYGGGIYTLLGKVNLLRTLITNNTAKNSGGGIKVDASTLTQDDSVKIVGNKPDDINETKVSTYLKTQDIIKNQSFLEIVNILGKD
jgi:predicted outer membrane repeat protein